MNCFITLVAAASFISNGTFITLNKQKMTAIIFTIGMGISRFSALVAFCNNIFCDSFTQPVVKNKILSYKFTWKAFFLYLLRIVDNTAFEMKYIFKSIMQHIDTGFFTTDAARTVHDNVFVFFI